MKSSIYISAFFISIVHFTIFILFYIFQNIEERYTL